LRLCAAAQRHFAREKTRPRDASAERSAVADGDDASGASRRPESVAEPENVRQTPRVRRSDGAPSGTVLQFPRAGAAVLVLTSLDQRLEQTVSIIG
jgi:hypothetical protein